MQKIQSIDINKNLRIVPYKSWEMFVKYNFFLL